uniref:Pectinesterase n=1 Tax=Cunninghamia lanceolata TaxID=28977 RepID=A0A6G9W5C3_CUNLA|nr:pectin methylesterase 1 [Cunninghamia lanceolata]
MKMAAFLHRHHKLLLFALIIQWTWPSLETAFVNGFYSGRYGWKGPVGSRYIVVDSQGRGHFGSVQAAVDSVRHGNRQRVIIEIRPGSYIEKVVVPLTKPYITLQGWGKERTVIEWHNKASDVGPDGQELHTYNTASVTVLANHFSARNITFKNSAPAPLPGMEGWQAASFRISGDKAYFLGCAFYGAQDTLCDDAGRHFFRECYIEGSIDFVFGNGQSLYYKSELHSVAPVFGSVAAQDRQRPFEKTGFSFVHCKVTGRGPLYLGRAMGQYSRIVFAYSYFEDIIAGWDDWDHQTSKDGVFFGLYRCYGPGARAARRTSWAHELTPSQAKPFLSKSFVNGWHWIPEENFD